MGNLFLESGVDYVPEPKNQPHFGLDGSDSEVARNKEIVVLEKELIEFHEIPAVVICAGQRANEVEVLADGLPKWRHVASALLTTTQPLLERIIAVRDGVAPEVASQCFALRGRVHRG